MSSRFLQLVSLAGGRVLLQCGQLRTRTTAVHKQFSNKSVFSSKKSSNSVYRTDYSYNQNKLTIMPIIPAVIAHRHFYHHQQQLLQQQKASPPLQFVYPFDLKTSGINNSSFDSYVTLFAARTRIGGSLFAKPVPVDMTQMGHQHNKECKRFYSKGKDRVKNKKSVVAVNEAEMRSVIDYDAFKNQSEQLVNQMKEEFVKYLSIRGTSGALESLTVEYEGEKYPLQELAQIGRKTPQLAVLNLSSLPDACQVVMKAIQDSGMNLNPQQEGTTIYVALPKVTREHRENLAKNAKTIFTKYKTSLQSVQNNYVRKCKSQKDLSEDLIFSVQQQIMKITESYVVEADKLLQSKQKELLETK